MPRVARVVAEGMPHHVIQRGNRRQQVFFEKEDREYYLEQLLEKSRQYDLAVWAYCLMDNHVHLVVVPQREESLAQAIGETHKSYTRMINFKKGWRGYLWEGRFKSFVLDERHLWACMRYVERNPVRAKMIERAENYAWSSAKAHVDRTKNALLSDCYLLDEIDDWAAYLAENDQEEDLKLFRRHGETGRPLGDTGFLEKLKKKLGIDVGYKKPGPKRA